jgi:hypothetical protein
LQRRSLEREETAMMLERDEADEIDELPEVADAITSAISSLIVAVVEATEPDSPERARAMNEVLAAAERIRAALHRRQLN